MTLTRLALVAKPIDSCYGVEHLRGFCALRFNNKTVGLQTRCEQIAGIADINGTCTAGIDVIEQASLSRNLISFSI